MLFNDVHVCFFFSMLVLCELKEALGDVVVEGFVLDFEPGRYKKINRKVQGVPQSQTAANLRHQEEEKNDKNYHVQNKQTNARETQSSLL